jgi:endonuclease/exonuclease/phosphatase (EEP) superfamily protein YafD
MGAIIILIGDLAATPWSDVARMLATPDIDHLAGFVGLVYAQARSLILALSLLAGIGAIVETLDKIQRGTA